MCHKGDEDTLEHLLPAAIEAYASFVRCLRENHAPTGRQRDHNRKNKQPFVESTPEITMHVHLTEQCARQVLEYTQRYSISGTMPHELRKKAVETQTP